MCNKFLEYPLSFINSKKTTEYLLTLIIKIVYESVNGNANASSTTNKITKNTCHTQQS